MNICVIGTGYVGLVVGSCLAEIGNHVICVDNNKDKINDLKKGIIPIYEPGLNELVFNNYIDKRLSFSCDLKASVKKSKVCYIAVGTPQNGDGSCDLSFVYDVAKEIGKALNNYKVIVDKSTVPVGTANKVREIISKETKFNFDVVSNPEFLKQGNAVEDFLKPDRIIIGSNSEKATKIMQEIYSPYLRTGNPIIIMDIKSAEMTKYASNSFLALKISYANQIANICEKVGANAEMVRIGMTTDSRIGKKFLFHGLGYGGSCFPKDVKALIKTAKDNDCDYDLLYWADSVNKNQRKIFINKILSHFKNDVKDKNIAIWGLSFKPNTNDLREAPCIDIIQELLNKKAKICAYDPKAKDNAYQIFKDKIKYAKNSYEAIKDADCLLLLTEWNEFRRPDFEKMKRIMRNPVIFDGRNQYDETRLLEKNFIYYSIGKKVCR